MLVPYGKVIGQFHLVYHIHHGGENLRQNGKHERCRKRLPFMPTSSNRICLRRHELFLDRRRKPRATIQYTSENNLCFTGPGNGASFCKVCKCGPSFSARVPCHDENNFGPSVAGRSENADGFRRFSRKFPFLHFVQSLHKGGKHFRQNGGYESHIARTLPVPASPNLGLPPATRKLCGKRTSRPRKSDRLIDWQRRNFSFCAFGTHSTNQHGIRCGQMTDEEKLKIVRNMNKAVFENW